MELFGEETRMVSIDESRGEEGLLGRTRSGGGRGRELDGRRTVGHVADDREVEEDLGEKEMRRRNESLSFEAQRFESRTRRLTINTKLPANLALNTPTHPFHLYDPHVEGDPHTESISHPHLPTNPLGAG